MTGIPSPQLTTLLIVYLKLSAYSLEGVLEVKEINSNYPWGRMREGWPVCFTSKEAWFVHSWSPEMPQGVLF